MFSVNRVVQFGLLVMFMVTMLPTAANSAAAETCVIPTPQLASPPVSEFVLRRSISVDDLNALLPGGTVITSAFERTVLPSGAVRMSGVTIPPELGRNALSAYDSYVVDELEESVREAVSGEVIEDEKDEPDGSSAPQSASNEIIDLSSAKAQYERIGGVPIKGFAVADVNQITSEVLARLGSNVQSFASDAVSDGCLTGGAATLSGASTAESQSATVDPSTFSPKRIRVKTYNQVKVQVLGEERQVYKAVARWRWSTARSVSYWSDKGRRAGAEVQLHFNVESNQGTWGHPPWLRGRPPSPSTNGEEVNFIPGVWTANFDCAYPDDYAADNIFGDAGFDDPGYSLTIGLGCHPRKGKLYRWTHLLNFGRDLHDKVRPEVQPVRFRKGLTEGSYCEHFQVSRSGSCYFSFGPIYQFKSTTDGRKSLTTPGAAIFAFPAGSTSGGTSDKPQLLVRPDFSVRSEHEGEVPGADWGFGVARYGEWKSTGELPTSYSLSLEYCSSADSFACTPASECSLQECAALTLPPPFPHPVSVEEEFSDLAVADASFATTYQCDPGLCNWVRVKVVAANASGTTTAYSFPREFVVDQ